MTKSQRLYIEEKFKDISEKQEVYLKTMVGYVNYQCFYLDYPDLPYETRDQLQCHIALSHEQEEEICDFLGISDEAYFLTRRELVRRLNEEEIRLLLMIQPEARMSLMVRFVEGRLQGNIGQVLKVAPKVTVTDQIEYIPNKLCARAIELFEKSLLEPNDPQNRQKVVEIISLLNQARNLNLLKDQELIIMAGALMNYEEREHWASHLSYAQRLKKAKTILSISE